ncbi:polyhydroxyalkanoic acid system family protein [Noviherbaspirillum denitrificans]|uniref:Polyhydroxyalkanoic acid system protein n=1 Tax=Noviherbaspirillum denitrificans TaxID=1968433 RepID=A0A254TGJ0_9BURK|nr:polyhydroxyalkanoic acid system family protein [Noviherbaspirillum denitrificans]OWW19653.1 polyhydroxyalkanoic acid system protein [Noviherbaspirillum denitrificans]
MADISIIQSHTLTHTKAKDAAQKVADQMAAEYEMNAEWDGDVLKFARSGVSGRLIVSDKDAHVEISLGFFFKAFASTIEQKVAAKMKKVFSATA